MALNFDMRAYGKRDEVYGARRHVVAPAAPTACADAPAYEDEPAADPIAVGRSFVFEAPDGARYRCADEGSFIRIEQCLHACGDIVLPSFIEGRPVTELAAGAFFGNADVRSVVLASPLASVGNRAFDGCASLERLEFPSDLDRFDISWVRRCARLAHLTLPGAASSLPPGLFAASHLKVLAIGPAMREVSAEALAGSKLERIEVHPDNPWLETDGFGLFEKGFERLISLAVPVERYEAPEGCRVIGRRACADNECLRKITLPNTVERVEAFAFASSRLECFDAPESLRDIGQKAFFCCSRLEDARLNDGLLSIKEGAFARSGLRRLKIPASVEELRGQAFSNTPLVCAGAGATLLVDPENTVLHLDAAGALYRRGSHGFVLVEMLASDTKTCFVMPGTVAIAPRAFVRHAAIRDVVLPEGLRRIGASAFRGCRALAHVRFPTTLEVVQDEAFYESGLRNLHLSSAFVEAGKNAFLTHGTNRNTEPPSLCDVRVDAGCARYYLASGLLCERGADGRSRALLYVGPETDVVVPHEVDRIAPYAFIGVRGVRSLYLHKGVREIGIAAFSIGERIGQVTVELKAPVNGCAEMVLEYPEGLLGERALALAFTEGRPRIEMLCYYRDDALLFMRDVHERSRMILERLARPLFLDPVVRERCEQSIHRNLTEICRQFAARNYRKGFDLLVGLGFVDADNIVRIVDEVNRAGDVAMTGYLLELKRLRFGTRAVDFDL